MSAEATRHRYPLGVAVAISLMLMAPTAGESQVVGHQKDSSTAATSQKPRGGQNLAEVDRAIHGALNAKSKADRIRALRIAQGALDSTRAPDELSGASRTADGARNLIGDGSVDRRLDALETTTRAGLREALMQLVWESPYGAVEVGDLAALETVASALSLVAELQRWRAGDPEAVKGLRATYWEWLDAYRARSAIAGVALHEHPSHPVVEQQVLAGESGAPEIYQLTGKNDGTLRWQPAVRERTPEQLACSESLVLDLGRERAPWLLMIAAADRVDDLSLDAAWLAKVRGHARLVVEAGSARAAALGVGADQSSTETGYAPYRLPGRSDVASVVSLIDVSRRVRLGTWPLGNLVGSGGERLRTLIAEIVSTGVPARPPRD